MATTALEKIQAIQDRANKEIEALKQEAVTELVKKISGVKSELATLEAEYATLTGKTLKGEKAGGTRRRLSKEEKEALVATVSAIIKGAKEGIKMGDIVKAAGESDSAVREAVKAVKGIKTTGNKASTLYFAK